MKVILSPNPYRDKGLTAVREAERILRSCGVETCLCLPFRPDRSLELPKDLKLRDIHTEIKNADLLICFGGDGTILHSARLARTYRIPILGVNMGSVGFMAELEVGELHLLRQIAQGKYTTEQRMMLDMRVLRDGRSIFWDTALNDVVISNGAVARVLDMTVYGDKVKIMEYSGDGVIVCTPTGSTAYSMSAGGPIVEPTAENIIITPICAHDLLTKSCVLGKERIVDVTVGHLSHKSAYLSADGGRAFRLSSGDTVELRCSSHTIKLVRLTGRSFYEILNQKLGRR
ncbi:MAG: NAD(+)/NADH kinase [Clostridiales bacterium]|nr:NAD(+)/NADH kinase [Clostridiales bacterium]MCD8051299.1 NAD(+)/NADH kinase [Clostridiales bacterium]